MKAYVGFEKASKSSNIPRTSVIPSIWFFLLNFIYEFLISSSSHQWKEWSWMFDKYRLNVLGDIGCLTPFLAKMNMYIPVELKSINVPPTCSKSVWFFSTDGAKLSLIKQLPSRLSSSLLQPIFFDFSRSISTAHHKLEVGLIHFTLGLFR